MRANSSRNRRRSREEGGGRRENGSWLGFAGDRPIGREVGRKLRRPENRTYETGRKESRSLGDASAVELERDGARVRQSPIENFEMTGGSFSRPARIALFLPTATTGASLNVFVCHWPNEKEGERQINGEEKGRDERKEEGRGGEEDSIADGVMITMDRRDEQRRVNSDHVASDPRRSPFYIRRQNPVGRPICQRTLNRTRCESRRFFCW